MPTAQGVRFVVSPGQEGLAAAPAHLPVLLQGILNGCQQRYRGWDALLLPAALRHLTGAQGRGRMGLGFSPGFPALLHRHGLVPSLQPGFVSAGSI